MRYLRLTQITLKVNEMFEIRKKALEGKLVDSFHSLCIVFMLREAVPPGDVHKKMPFVKVTAARVGT
jgi:activator of 2-hydroxyglutaryl-CoA dehydratase